MGVHNDNIVNQRRGLNFPIMNLHERVLSIMGCKVHGCTTSQPFTLFIYQWLSLFNIYAVSVLRI